MHQIHLYNFNCTFHRDTTVCGFLTIYYMNSSSHGFRERYIIDVTDSSLVGWDTNDLEVNMLASFIPRFVVFRRKQLVNWAVT